jgi:hypothetical protein
MIAQFLIRRRGQSHTDRVTRSSRGM